MPTIRRRQKREGEYNALSKSLEHYILFKYSSINKIQFSCLEEVEKHKEEIIKFITSAKKNEGPQLRERYDYDLPIPKRREMFAEKLLEKVEEKVKDAREKIKDQAKEAISVSKQINTEVSKIEFNKTIEKAEEEVEKAEKEVEEAKKEVEKAEEEVEKAEKEVKKAEEKIEKAKEKVDRSVGEGTTQDKDEIEQIKKTKKNKLTVKEKKEQDVKGAKQILEAKKGVKESRELILRILKGEEEEEEEVKKTEEEVEEKAEEKEEEEAKEEPENPEKEAEEAFEMLENFYDYMDYVLMLNNIDYIKDSLRNKLKDLKSKPNAKVVYFRFLIKTIRSIYNKYKNLLMGINKKPESVVILRNGSVFNPTKDGKIKLITKSTKYTNNIKNVIEDKINTRNEIQKLLETAQPEMELVNVNVNGIEFVENANKIEIEEGSYVMFKDIMPSFDTFKKFKYELTEYEYNKFAEEEFLCVSKIKINNEIEVVYPFEFIILLSNYDNNKKELLSSVMDYFNNILVNNNVNVIQSLGF